MHAVAGVLQILGRAWPRRCACLLHSVHGADANKRKGHMAYMAGGVVQLPSSIVTGHNPLSIVRGHEYCPILVHNTS